MTNTATRTPSVYLVSLGCSKNLVESETFMGFLAQRGIELSPDPDTADALVVNTCGFLQSAADESFEVIREMVDLKGHGKKRKKGVYVFGCLVGRDRERMERELQGVDGFFGVAQMKAVADAIARNHGEGHPLDDFTMRGGVLPRLQATPPHTAYLRISDGCDCRCTFCTIPSIRGRHTSRPIDDLAAQVEQMTAEGVRELTLIAQDSTQYGKDLYGEMCLERLLERFDGIEDLDWYRVMYAFPAHVTDRFLEFLSRAKKFCDYLDMPVQHADTDVLRRMARGTTAEKQLRLIECIREARPGISLRTTILVGFPGETEEAFERLVDFMETVRFDHVGVFPYSPEPGTPSVNMPGAVPEEVIDERFERISEIVIRIGAENAEQKVGSERDVIIDGPSDVFPDFLRGRHKGQAPDVDGITYVKKNGHEPGDIVRCRILGSRGFDLFGEATS